MHIFSLYLEKFIVALAPKIVPMCFWMTSIYFFSSLTQMQKKPLEDGPLCKTDTFQFSKSFRLKRFEFFNNSFTTREKSVLYRETTPLH